MIIRGIGRWGKSYWIQNCPSNLERPSFIRPGDGPAKTRVAQITTKGRNLTCLHSNQQLARKSFASPLAPKFEIESEILLWPLPLKSKPIARARSLSSGPSSPEGNAKRSHNALTTGLTGPHHPPANR